jgi:hypothetical protein
VREPRLNLLPFSSRPVEHIGANQGPLREKVPPSRFDLSNTGICGAMPFSSTSSPQNEPPATPEKSKIHSANFGASRRCWLG